MATEYRVVFAGAVLDGHTVEEVKQTAGKRLKVTPEQLIRLFSGKPVVLKKGLNMNAAEQYVGELNRIGMKARIEPQPQPKAHLLAPEKPEPQAQPAPPQISWPQLQVDESEKTQLADAATLQQYLGITDSEQLPATHAEAPTYIVPKNEVIATRQRLEQALSAQDNLAQAPTVIVSQNEREKIRATLQPITPLVKNDELPFSQHEGRSSIAILKESTDALRKASVKHGKNTLIADEDTLNAYLKSSSETGPTDIAESSATPPISYSAQIPPLQKETPTPPPIAPLPGSYAVSSTQKESIPTSTPSSSAENDSLSRKTVPISPGQAQKMLSSSIPQIEYELPPPRRGVGITLKILLSVVAVGIVAGIGVLLWIIVEQIRS